MDLLVGSYHPRSWWPLVKLMSVLWKMAAHWKGAFSRQYMDLLNFSLAGVRGWLTRVMGGLTPCMRWQVVQ